MGTPNYPKGIGDAFNDLRRRAAAAYTSSNTRKALTKIQAAALDLFGDLIIKPGGRLIAQYKNGATALQVGANTLSDGTPVHGVLIRRPGGETVLFTFGPDSGGSAYWALYDRSGNIVVSDDANSGQGLATPYIPLTAVPTTRMVNRQESTTSTAFVALYTINGTKQHPKMRFRAIVQSDAGVTGEMRVTNPLNGAVLLAVQSIAAGSSFNTAYTFTVPGAHQSLLQLDIEVRVASGSGSVGLTVLNVEGIQS